MGTRTSLKRTGAFTDAEKLIVSALVADSPREVEPSQISSLARAMRRSKAAVLAAVQNAQADFRNHAGRYVEIHQAAVEAALANGSPKALEVALKGSEWAIDRISQDGTRIVEPKTGEGPASGPRVMIGIRLGGIDATKEQPIEVTATEVKE